MTTTSERCRALRWGAEILSEMQVEPSVSGDLAERARALIQSYPSSSVIDALEEGQALQLTPQQIQAIDDTSALLRRLPALGVALIEPSLEATLRHFPLPGEENGGFWWNLWPRI